MHRQQLLSELTTHIDSIKSSHPLRVAIDGVDTAGKTSLADELVSPLQKNGRSVIRASIDSFHNPQSIRYQQGKHSPAGYFQDSFNHQALISLLLAPLGPGGNLHYQKEIFDFQKDSLTKQQNFLAQESDILLFDGVFLLRPELYNYWDLKIFVKVNFETVLKRAAIRDQKLFGTIKDVQNRYQQKYIPGQKIYLAACTPEKLSDIVIQNDDPMTVEIVWKDQP
ncbi:MAG: hypothetical protein DWQ04_09850 [Chloroflexi bacterium]|nr:MAG: hypothetical protein DWQ04_09850 [Chloroflexota bacterium]